jgi:hypothetical protein
MNTKRLRGNAGQALIETALMLPILLVMLINAANLGYFFLVVLNITAAPRSGLLYAIVGPSSPAATNYPAAGGASTTTVSYLTQQDLTGALYNPAANATVQVCSQIIGTNGSGSAQKSNCISCTGGTCGSVNSGGTGEVPDADPEAPSFVLHRVDVGYTFSPLIPGWPFNLALLSTSVCNAAGTSCTFHRFAEMRAM